MSRVAQNRNRMATLGKHKERDGGITAPRVHVGCQPLITRARKPQQRKTSNQQHATFDTVQHHAEAPPLNGGFWVSAHRIVHLKPFLAAFLGPLSGVLSLRISRTYAKNRQLMSILHLTTANDALLAATALQALITPPPQLATGPCPSTHQLKESILHPKTRFGGRFHPWAAVRLRKVLAIRLRHLPLVIQIELVSDDHHGHLRPRVHDTKQQTRQTNPKATTSGEGEDWFHLLRILHS